MCCIALVFLGLHIYLPFFYHLGAGHLLHCKDGVLQPSYFTTVVLVEMRANSGRCSTESVSEAYGTSSLASGNLPTSYFISPTYPAGNTQYHDLLFSLVELEFGDTPYL